MTAQFPCVEGREGVTASNMTTPKRKPGAKPKHRTVKYTVRVTPAIDADVRKQAMRREITINEYVNERLAPGRVGKI